MKVESETKELGNYDALHFTLCEMPDQLVPAWEEVGEGRYMPRRVRGSYHGRALG